MKIPLQITFRNLLSSEAVETTIRERAAKLDLFYDRITSCRVLVEAPHRRHHRGRLYLVRIDMTVPGSEIVVNREPSEHSQHEDLYVAIRDAFDAAGRQLQDYVRLQRGGVKSHEPAPVARVSRLFLQEGYGFLESPEGREIYFHKNSVVNGSFDELQVGAEAHFTEEPGEKGPQASTVRAVKR
jgi:cold shock CspA family protein/ribosome-associated translation inhibitor RaiA